MSDFIELLTNNNWLFAFVLLSIVIFIAVCFWALTTIKVRGRRLRTICFGVALILITLLIGFIINCIDSGTLFFEGYGNKLLIIISCTVIYAGLLHKDKEKNN